MTLLVDAPQIPFVQAPGTLPGRIAGLAQLAQNLAWSWNRDARSLFKSIDESLWNRTRHNPMRPL
jgi:starch phosphorylase